MRANYITDQKQIIKQEVSRVVDMVRYEQSQAETVTRLKIKSRGYEAYSIVQNIYEQNKASKNAAEIQQMIIDALRPIRFEQGTGYYFATRRDGVVMLFADKPEMEGLNLLDMQDTRGKFVIKEMIQIAEQFGEGFYEYHWTKPDRAGNDFKKISFIKRFEPYNWFIGTGLYVDDVENQIKADLFSAISRIRFGKEGYIFVNKLNGDTLVSNGKLFPGTEKLWEVFNDNAEKMKDIFQKEYNAALKPEGDYIYYSHIKLTNPNKESPKASFIYGINELQWIVGAGVYLDDVETDIALMKTELNNQIKGKILYNILTVMGIVVLFSFFFSWLSRLLKNDLNLFTSFFNRAAHTDEEIDPKQIKFVELYQMAEYANKMLKDRKRAETLLLESEQKYRQFVETAKEGFWAIDAEQRTTFVNRHMTEMLGYSPEEMLGESVQTFMFEEDLPDHDAKIEQRKQGYGGAFERRYRHKDGGEVWTHASATAVMDSEGLFTGSYALFTDITERKRIEEALRVSEERLRILFNGINEAVFVHEGPENGIPGLFIVVNDRACERLGYSRNELLTMRPTDIDAPETVPNVPTMIESLYAKGDAVWEGVHISKNGNRIPVEIGNRLAHLDGRQIIISTVRDITERKQMEQKLQQSQKLEAVGALAGGIAHDFNNILYPIVGFSEMLLEDLPAGSPDHENVGVIFKAAKRAADLVKQILFFSRQAEHEKMPVRLQHILKEVLKLTRSTIPSSIDIITPSIQSDCGLVMADPTQLHQIAMNLITNAYHAVEETGGSISIQLKESVLTGEDWADTLLESGRYAVLSVTDNGCGIDPADMGKIFEPFYTTKELGKGTGLGLSVVYGIVKDYGGEIRVYSEVRKGTTFTVYLPIIKKGTETVSAEELVIYETGTERILLVDDEEPIVQLEKRMLERLGYHVEERTSSIEALKAFRANPKAFNLVITDMNMPNMAGDKLAGKLRSIKPGIPVIICTGFSTKIDEQKAQAMGINGCLMKPVVKSEMAQMVRKVLDETKG